MNTVQSFSSTEIEDIKKLVRQDFEQLKRAKCATYASFAGVSYIDIFHLHETCSWKSAGKLLL
ncbi:MAG: hypothetical protein IK065_05875 [Neisseriaceae bacterium]|nr:hypothetical protein [Neisseriaceae bacterium]